MDGGEFISTEVTSATYDGIVYDCALAGGKAIALQRYESIGISLFL